jgi:hypothetical protein
MLERENVLAVGACGECGVILGVSVAIHEYGASPWHISKAWYPGVSVVQLYNTLLISI